VRRPLSLCGVEKRRLTTPGGGAIRTVPGSKFLQAFMPDALKSQHNLASFCQIYGFMHSYSEHYEFILVCDVPQSVLAVRAISRARMANLRRERARRS
jgi:hypothetical protein